MNRIFIIAIFALLFALGCTKEEVDTLGSLSLTVKGENVSDAGDGHYRSQVDYSYAGSYKVAIETASNWEASIKYLSSNDLEWVTLSKLTGSGSDEIAVDVDKNIYITYRKAIITVKTLDNIPIEKKFTIQQHDSEPMIDIITDDCESANFDPETKTLKLDYNGFTAELPVWANMESYRVTVEADPESGDDANWVIVNVRNEVMQLIVDNNFTKASRKARLKLEVYGANTQTFYYSIEQSESLYKNVLVDVDGQSSAAILKSGSYDFAPQSITLNLDSDQSLAAELIDIQTDAAATWASANVAGTIVTVALTENDGSGEKSALLRVKATDAAFSAQKPLEWKVTQKAENLEIEWLANPIDETLIFGPTGRSAEVVLANCKAPSSSNISIEITPVDNWLEVTYKNGAITMTRLDAATSDREVEMTIKTQSGRFSKKIKIAQKATSNIIEKKKWSIAFGNTNTTELLPDYSKNNIIDGNNATHWEWWWNQPAPSTSAFPYQFVIDLSSEQVFNAFDYQQTINWCNGPVKEIQFEASSNELDWIDMGKFTMATSPRECVAKGGLYHIISNKTVKARYVRMSLLSNTGPTAPGDEGPGGEGVNVERNAKCSELSIFLK